MKVNIYVNYPFLFFSFCINNVKCLNYLCICIYIGNEKMHTKNGESFIIWSSIMPEVFTIGLVEKTINETRNVHIFIKEMTCMRI